MEADILPVEAIADPRTFADSAVLHGLLTRVIAAVRAGQSDAIRCSVPMFQVDSRTVPRGAPGTHE